jgi:hypothetical protein
LCHVLWFFAASLVMVESYLSTWYIKKYRDAE